MKERLTGAIILVALLVLLVPELLSGPGSSAATAHPPAADGQQMRSYTIDLADDAATHRSAAAPVAAAPVPQAPESKPIEATANDAQPAREVTDAPGSSGTSSVERAPSAPPAARASGGESTRAADSAAAAEPAAARAVTPPPSRPATADLAGGWAVQVGSFASRENAERLARELKGKGFESHVNESSGKGKRLWRVRVGPEPDRDRAMALGARLRAVGQPGSVVPMP